MNRNLIHVAAAVIRNNHNEILIAKRPDDKHQGGLWEFPGGKVEPGEPVEQALARELNEELGISILNSRPLIQIPYHYPDKSVLLDVFEVTSFTGQAYGREGQPVEWVSASSLEGYAFPEANKPIVDACLLPSALAITPFNIQSSDLIPFVECAVKKGAEGIVLRFSGLSNQTEPSSEIKSVCEEVIRLCKKQNLFVSVNTSVSVANDLSADAVHLSSIRLAELEQRGEFNGRWLSASCHEEDELKAAEEKGCDFVFLSPVLETTSHPEAKPLGWDVLSALLAEARLPAFALGGVTVEDQTKAFECGAQGIAAISAWLEE